MATIAPPQTAAKPALDAVRPSVRPILLVILDGFGCRPDAPDNAITRAKMPNWNHLLAACPHTTIDASELKVGLPSGQMGNSEVGHLNMGAGRVVMQDLVRIDETIRDRSFFANPVFVNACENATRRGGTVHLMGLIGNGGVHAIDKHLFALID